MPPPVDVRAWVAVGCAVLVFAALLLVDTALTVLFGTLGVAYAGVAVIASDARATPPTRRLAGLAALVIALALIVALRAVLFAPQSGE